MTARLVQNAFNSGELSPQMLGRADLAYYRAGARKIENFLIRPQGGIFKRSGTRFVREAVDSSVKGRLIPFIFSTTQAYILEFSENLIRFFMDEGSVLETAQNITAVTQADPPQVTIAGHPFSTGEMVFIDGIVGMTELNSRHFTLTKVDGNNFTLDGEDSTGYTAYTSGGTASRVYQVTTTYTEDELPDLRFAQSADVLYITHEDHAPATLTRTAHTSWTLADHSLIDGPYLRIRTPEVGDDTLADTVTLAVAAVVGDDQALTAGGVGFFDGTRDVGRILRYVSGGTAAGGILIDQVTNATTARGDIVSGDDPSEQPPQLPNNAATTWWYIGAYYPENYPRYVCFFEGRLLLASTPLEPERFDGSVVGGWDDFRPALRADGTINDDEAYSFQLGGSADVQVIRWMATARNLLIGTSSSVFSVQASSLNESVTPLNINVQRTSAHGCSDVQPVVAFDTVLHISRSSKKVLAAIQTDETTPYRVEDITIMAEHVTGTGISEMSFQQDPNSIIWALRSDGQLAGVTYNRYQKVFGWHRQIVGGSFSTGDAVIESIATIPSPNDDHDQTWMMVKRTVNGSTVRYIEFLEQDFSDSDDIEDAYFVDCGLTYDSTATSTISGLNHLEGETVTVLADGAVHPNCTVSGGEITLNGSYSVVHVGYGYNADCWTLPIMIWDASGASAGKMIRPARVYLRLHRTLGLQYGSDTDDLVSLPFRAAGDPTDEPPPLFTGIKDFSPPHGYDEEAGLYLRQADPLPAMILYAGAEVGISSR